MRSHYVLGLAWAGLAGCASHAVTGTTASLGPGTGGAVRVVAVERVYGDLAAQLGGSAVSVTTILNSPSADPHAYEATPRDADAFAMADIALENGLGYDAFADKLIAASPRSGRTVIVAATLAHHATGDNPHVWYEIATLRAFNDAVAAELGRRLPARRASIERRHGEFASWLAAFAAHLVKLGAAHAHERVAITEPVFDYVLHAAGLAIATPGAFSHAIEEGNDPAPQDVDFMRALLAHKRVAAFVYNRQTVEPSTTQLLDLARNAHVAIVPVTETLPANETTQMWIDGEVAALERAL